MTKTCSKCFETKPLGNFRAQRNACRDCGSKERKAWGELQKLKPVDTANSLETKRCAKCRHIKLLREFTTQRGNKNGVGSYCKPCAMIQWRSVHDKQKAARLPRILAKREAKLARTEKACTRCKTVKHKDQFPKDTRYVEGIKGYCKGCARLLGKRWRTQNPGRVKELNRVNNAKQLWKAWRKNNPDKARQTWQRSHERRRERTMSTRTRPYKPVKKTGKPWTPENARSYHKEWRKQNPGTVKAWTQRRRAAMVGANGYITAQEWVEVAQQYGPRCLACEKLLPLSMDHVVPISKGGWNSKFNIQPLCRSCNSRKNDKVMDYRLGAELMEYWISPDFISHQSDNKGL